MTEEKNEYAFDEVPNDVRELLIKLDKAFPEACPENPDTTIENIMFYAGKRWMIKYLILMYNRDNPDNKIKLWGM